MSHNKRNNREYEIPEDVKHFCKASFKKFKKKYGDEFESKKEMAKAFYYELTEYLPDVIDFLIQNSSLMYSNNPRRQDIKNDFIEIRTAVKEQMNEDFLKVLKKAIKNGDEIKKIKLLPIILREFILEYKDYDNEEKAKNPNFEDDHREWINIALEVGYLILKKKINKMDEKITNKDLAIDLYFILPDDNLLQKYQNYRIKAIMDTLFAHTEKDESIDFKQVMKIFIDKDYYPGIIKYALMEYKQRDGRDVRDSLSAHKTSVDLYNQITIWCFDEMEKLNNDTLKELLIRYIKERKVADDQNRDHPRRYCLNAISEVDYPRIAGCIKVIKSNDANAEKYFA